MVIIGEFCLTTYLGQGVRIGFRPAHFKTGGRCFRDVRRNILPGCLFHGTDDTLITGTAAIGIFQSGLDIIFTRHFTHRLLFIQQGFGRHDHTGGTYAALYCTMVQECLLQRMQTVIRGQTFDGLDTGTGCLESGVGTTHDRRAIDQHRTDTAFCFITTNLGAGQTKILT